MHLEGSIANPRPYSLPHPPKYVENTKAEPEGAILATKDLDIGED